MEEKTLRNIFREREELGDYLSYDGNDSHTEYMQKLLDIAQFPAYMSQSMHDAVVSEILDRLDYYRKYTRKIIVEEQVTVRTYRLDHD